MISFPLSQYVRNALGLAGLCIAGSFPGVQAQVIPGKVPFNTTPTRTVGQAQNGLVSGAPNLVEGRELNQPNDIAVDPVSKAVYVCDTGNNRVLAWRSESALTNGAAADLVIGQRDRFSTQLGGPDTVFKSGLIGPTSIAVDRDGNLYVADSGNNRILRYSTPFQQPTDGPVLADFVIGQPTVNTGRSPNNGGRTASSLALSNGNTIYSSGMDFDSGGNLWVTDPGNGRVLRYPAGLLGAGRPNNPSADLVLGQPGFTQFESTSTVNQKLTLREPASLAFDSAGRLFVPDLLNRVVVYTAPFSSGGSAQRIMGIPPPTPAGQAPLPPVNEYTVGVVAGSNVIAPGGVFAIGDIPFVVDSGANRILRFPPFTQWPIETELFSPAATAVIGQDSLRQTLTNVNRGLPEPGSNGFARPNQGFFADGKTYIADTLNHRVLIFGDLSTGPATSNTAYQANAVLGQLDFTHGAANLAEGREFASPSGVATFTGADGIQQMFVADSSNNRVLGFRDARNIKPGAKADLVIGQKDFGSVLVNSPFNDNNQRTSSSLFRPTAVAVDKQGNLYVADTGNSRVLRFPQPFAADFQGAADVVIGQSSFTGATTDPTSRTMAAPIGLAFTVEGLLAVADATLHRVLVFTPPFSTGMAASTVIGQPDFSSTLIGTAADKDRFNQPRGVAVDSDDRLYVADFNNSRVQVFSRVPLLANNPAALFSIPSNQPNGVAVSQLTGEVWALESGTARRYPKYDTLIVSGAAADYQLVPQTGQGTINNGYLGVAIDRFNNLYLSEAAHRISVYYPFVATCNGASFVPSVTAALTPGMVATVSTAPDRGCEGGLDLVYTFTTATKVFNELPNPIPLPRTLEDLQVLVNGTPAPLYFVSPFQINFQVPNDAPTSGTTTVEVIQPSTGRVIGAATVAMEASSPSLFTLSFEKGVGSTIANRQVAALNQDGTVNSEQNPAVRGQFVSLYGTGIGPIAGQPAEGTPAGGALPSPKRVRVGIGADIVEPGENIPYSGLAPGLVGVWQVNVKIPDVTPPGANAIGISVDDRAIFTLPFRYRTVIWVK